MNIKATYMGLILSCTIVTLPTHAENNFQQIITEAQQAFSASTPESGTSERARLEMNYQLEQLKKYNIADGYNQLPELVKKANYAFESTSDDSPAVIEAIIERDNQLAQLEKDY
jgi:hypothetical protein